MSEGIYLLGFRGTHKVYIGQSDNIENRYKQHLYKFSNNTHTKKLQEAYSLYGVPSIEIIEECSAAELNTRENYYIQLWSSVEDGFNTQIEAGSWPILPGDTNPNAKYSNEQIEVVLMFLVYYPEMTCQEVADEVGISRGMVKMISRRASHTWLEDKYPVEYSVLKSMKGSNESIYKTTGYPPLISPEGKVYYGITNVTSFCHEHHLTQVSVSMLYLGKRTQHKGWKVYKV